MQIRIDKALRLLVLGIVSVWSCAAQADSLYTVNTGVDLIDDNTDDAVCHTSANTCSLRAATMQANHLIGPGTATIMLPAGYYGLTRPINGPNGEDNGDLNLTQPNSNDQFIAIIGAGAASTFIDGNQQDGVITIDPNRRAGFRGVTIRNGFRSVSGGGIRNFGILVMVESEVQDNNTSGSGGGIYNTSMLSIVRSTIASNSAMSDGGGIYSSGTLSLSASTVRTNMARANFGQGGGMYLSGPATVRSSTLHQNGANNGGGLLTISDLTVVNSTITATPPP